VFARSPISLSRTPFSRSLRSTICKPGQPYPMRTLRIINGGPERAKKRSLGEREGRSCKQRIAVTKFGVCDFSRLAVTDWRLWFLALMTATRHCNSLSNFRIRPEEVSFYFIIFKVSSREN